MKILWLINIPLPEASFLMGEIPSPYGGWLINASKDIAMQEDIELSIAFPSKKVPLQNKIKGERINYYPFKPIKVTDAKAIRNNRRFQEVLEETTPDIVHIYGTEYSHTLSMVNVCNKMNIETVISIQGLVSIYASHMYANLPFRAVYSHTLRNIIRRDSVYGQKKSFEKSGKHEVEALQNTKHIIGRTTWDKACTQQINSEARYHFCNETLREEFYKYKWDIERCEKHSIFLSQGSYSIKGLHNMLDALPLILKKYPKAKVYIGGHNIIKSDTLKDKLLMTYYGKYIAGKIKRLGLEEKIIFTGPLDEKKMCQRYLKSNVFVCPSSIENSPNSLGEAMILGVPSVASNVGGVPDMLSDREEGFIYQSDAPYMLAHYISEIFEKEDLAKEFSKKARRRAFKTHNRVKNTEQLINIYKKIKKTK